MPARKLRPLSESRGSPLRPQRTRRHECVEVLQDFIILALRYQNAHRGYGKMVYASLQYMAKADWQSTLQSLRDVIRRHRIPPKALGDLLTSWRLFGATLGFNETPSGARSSFCGSNKCKYHKTIAPFRMRRSCVCKRVRYCDGRCQQRDWTGGHKVSCPRARTIRGRLLKTKIQKHQREHGGEPI
ncbi:hypothetical protein OF83DRAFT_921538 [Amylostereum chailletii]|nr:hypothetical protein OF83DRAFT_921538 [Amylostereum chailletii]